MILSLGDKELAEKRKKQLAEVRFLKLEEKTIQIVPELKENSRMHYILHKIEARNFVNKLNYCREMRKKAIGLIEEQFESFDYQKREDFIQNFLKENLQFHIKNQRCQ